MNTARKSHLPGCLRWLALALAVAWPGQLPAASLPSKFVEENIGSGWNEVVGLTFSADGRLFVWERGGRVWNVEDGVKGAKPFLDIREEVGVWNNFGLLGFCLHPDFLNNGYVYLLYAVDPHHLKHFGTSKYDSDSSDTHEATIGRITRYTARTSDALRSVDPASRLVLVGESATNGFPLISGQHGVGTILVGSDGTLLASCGDGASSSITDIGSGSGTYYKQALDDGIIQLKENVGAYRAQLVDSLNGKVIRIAPETGDGIPSNPFYDPARPRSARSRVWALGLKTPSRMALRPGTGNHRRTDADPGALYIGDVGWNTWEDLNVCDRPGMNFGWPAYEGMEANSPYFNAKVQNLDAPNPLYDVGDCTRRYFYFTDLLKQDSLDAPSWPNPCNAAQQIPASIPRFVHARPALDYKQGSSGPARTPTYSGRNAAVVNVGASGSPVRGSAFGGNCIIGGAWYTASDFPSSYRNTYFVADYGEQWIKNMIFDENNALVEVRKFASSAGGVVFLGTHPLSGALYYVTWTSAVKKIRYVADGNLPPTARASADKTYGPGPLPVRFTGNTSTDPEALPLAYQWDFGDGSPINTNANPVHEFNAPTNVPTRYDVALRVTDRSGAFSDAALIISVNNTPPSVVITSPVDGGFYPMTGDTLFPCTALVNDLEHDASQLSCAWITILHHNNHIHSEPVDTNCATTTVLSPEGCDGQTYFYRVVLTVTDAAGLSATNEARLYPNCPGVAPVIFWMNPADLLAGAALSATQLNARANVPGTFVYNPAAGAVLNPGTHQLLSVTFTPQDATFAPITASVRINVLTLPAAPDHLTAVAVSLSQIYLTWTDRSTHETGFELEQSTDGVTFAPLVLLGPNVTAYTNTGLLPDTAYSYRVGAFNTVGDSGFAETNGAVTPPFTGAKINFQPASVPVPAGSVADAGLKYGDRVGGLIYGWDKSNKSNAKERESSRSPDIRYDTLIHTYKTSDGTVWEIAVPNGDYEVVLVAGDPENTSPIYKFDVEGVLTVDGEAKSSRRWISGTNTVSVTDGRLTVSNALGFYKNRVCFIEITPLP